MISIDGEFIIAMRELIRDEIRICIEEDSFQEIIDEAIDKAKEKKDDSI